MLPSDMFSFPAPPLLPTLPSTSPDTLPLAALLMRRPVSLPVCLRPRLSVLQDPCRILDGGQMFLVALAAEWTDCVSIAPPLPRLAAPSSMR